MSPSWKNYGYAVLAIVLAVGGPAALRADDQCGSGGCCQKFHCPHTKVCTEGPPCICFRQGCARPIINPCNQPNWGYYQPCWAPWPWPPDWSHCPVPVPAQMVFPPGPPVESANRVAPPIDEGLLPVPRTVR